MKSLLFLMLFSCVSKHNFAGKNFKSSNSLCLDALVVNMETDGCKSIEAVADEDKKLLKIFCDDEQVAGSSPWLNYIFYFSRTELEGDDPPGTVLCVDPSLTMVYQHRYQDEQ